MKQTTPRSESAATPLSGFIYILKDGNGLLKIGASSNPLARLAALQTGSPTPLILEYAGALCCDGHSVEAKAHEILARHRLNGEWFDCVPEAAVGAIAAAAHSLGKVIASVPIGMVDDLVRQIALDAAAPEQKPRPSFAMRLFAKAVVLIIQVIIISVFVLFVFSVTYIIAALFTRGP
ncbi:MAG: GIY-YIG nuclease family protein [Methylocella sp.]